MTHVPPLTGPVSESTSPPMYFERHTGLGPGAYPSEPQAVFGFDAAKTIIRFISGTGPVYFSLNGVDNHGVVDAGAGLNSRELEVVASRVWFKNGTTAVVDVHAEPFM